MSLDTEVLKVLCVCVCVCDRFKIEQFDTGISYPDDPRKEPRDKELELMKNIYQYRLHRIYQSRSVEQVFTLGLCHAMLCINMTCDWLCVCATPCYA